MRLMLVAVGLLLLIGAGSAAGTTQAQQLKHSTDVLRFFDNHSWLVAPNKDKCTEVPWQKSCRIGRLLVKQHTAQQKKIKRIIFYTLPDTDNWTRAVRITQRVFPGTDEWLFRISGRECRACYTVPGAFVCNYEGSGACGPMQFMSGTFWGHVYEAKAAAEKKGFIIPNNVWDWRHPLGQALTAGHMRYTDIDGCHWCQTDY